MITLNQIKKLNKEAFKVSFKRKRSLEGFRVINITAYFENYGGYEKSFILDEVKGVLYQALYIGDENEKADYKADTSLKIENFDMLFELFRIALNNSKIQFKFDKKTA